MTPAEALDHLPTEPVDWQNTNGRISSVVPADMVADSGETVETFLDSTEVLHELGLLTWDDTRRVHIQAFPHDNPVGP